MPAPNAVSDRTRAEWKREDDMRAAMRFEWLHWRAGRPMTHAMTGTPKGTRKSPATMPW